MPRKTVQRVIASATGTGASMRPRPDAAENPPHAARARAAELLASMRPRPDAAENRSGSGSPRTTPSRLQ